MKPRISESGYVTLTIGAFVFAPEVRRLVDWRGNFDPINFSSIVPLLMLLPIAIFVYKRRRKLGGTDFVKVAAIWTIAFVYAFIVGVAQTLVLPGMYGLALFLLPVLVGAWFVVQDEPLAKSFSRLSRDLFWFGAVAGVYAIVQFVFAPPWDTAWMININSTAFGQPERFGIRAFSVMNSPGTYAEFTAFCLLLNLPNLRPGRVWSLGAAMVMIVGLLLTLVRSAWIGFVLGAIVFAILSPRRRAAIASLLTVSVTCAAVAVAYFSFVPSDEIRDTLVTRFQTLTGVSTDSSTLAREQSSSLALASGAAAPLGHGLGITGPPAALASRRFLETTDVPPTIDNGFLSRLVEMGVPGCLFFAAAVLLALVASFRSLRSRIRSGNDADATIAAAALSTQIAIFFVCFSGDVYAGVGALIFFIAVALGTKTALATSRDAPIRTQPSPKRRRRSRTRLARPGRLYGDFQ
jgi:hypothetical protein